jgi:hypothetical protein
VPLHRGFFGSFGLVIECRREEFDDLVAGERRRLAELVVEAHAEGVRGRAARALGEVFASAALRRRGEFTV